MNNINRSIKGKHDVQSLKPKNIQALELSGIETQCSLNATKIIN